MRTDPVALGPRTPRVKEPGPRDRWALAVKSRYKEGAASLRGFRKWSFLSFEGRRREYLKTLKLRELRESESQARKKKWGALAKCLLLYLLEKGMVQEGAGTRSAEKGEERPASPHVPDFQTPAAHLLPSNAPRLLSSAR